MMRLLPIVAFVLAMFLGALLLEVDGWDAVLLGAVGALTSCVLTVWLLSTAVSDEQP